MVAVSISFGVISLTVLVVVVEFSTGKTSFVVEAFCSTDFDSFLTLIVIFPVASIDFKSLFP